MGLRRVRVGQRFTACALAAFWCCAAQAQSEPGRSYTFEPRLELRQTFTSNVDLVPNGDSGAITEIRPGILISGQGARLRGTLDYTLGGVIYLGDSGRNEIQHDLAARGTLEVVEGRLFVDAFATASQELIDPFGTRPANPDLPSSNTTQTFTYGISPYAEGTLGGTVDYLFRLNYSASTNAESSVYDSREVSGLARLEGGTVFQRLRWALTAAGRTDDYQDEERTRNYGVAASLIYAVTPYLNVRGNAGVEYQDYATIDTERSSVYGVGFDWQPTDRTLLAAGVENRFFGNAYRIQFQHRTPRTVWSFSDTYGISEVSGVSSVSFGSNYDLLFRQFESIEPDPVKREALVRDFLRSNNIDPDQQAVAGFLTTNVQLQRAQDFSFAWVGRRNTLTAAVGQRRTSQLARFLEVDDFENSTFVRERGWSLGFSHRLTPLSSIGLLLSETRTSGDDAAPETREDRLELTWGTSLGERTGLAVTARRVDFDSPTSPYTENAVEAVLLLRF